MGGPPMGGPPMGGPPPGAMGPKTNMLGIVSLVLGICAWTIAWCCGFGPIFALVGIILGAIALVQIKNQPEVYTGRGIALAGLIVNIVGFVLITIMLILAVAMGALDEIMRSM